MAASKDYIDLSVGGPNWDQARPMLDAWIKRLNQRLDAQEGRSGVPTFYADVNMNGNRILNGPSGQTSPAATEFVTGAYAATKLTKNGVNFNGTVTQITVVDGQITAIS